MLSKLDVPDVRNTLLIKLNISVQCPPYYPGPYSSYIIYYLFYKLK